MQEYEVYVDSLFLINFCMNLLCLKLVSLSCLKEEKRWGRLLLGAALGTVIYLSLFLLPGGAGLRMALGGILSGCAMLFTAFPIRSLEAFVKMEGRLLLYSMAVGGGLLFFMRLFKAARGRMASVFGILGVGFLLYLMFARFLSSKRKDSARLYEAVLIRKERSAAVLALLDSGNSLREPISGKPVCIVEEEILEKLWEPEEIQGFRAIPYHSVGCSKGILRGFLLPTLLVETEEGRASFTEVYVAAAGEVLSKTGEYQMLLQPELFEAGVVESSFGGRTGRQDKKMKDGK